MKSFLHGKKSLAVPALRLPPGLTLPSARQTVPAPARSCASAAAAASAPTGEPHVEVVKEGDKVVRLVVSCRCGERIEVECLYPAGS